MSLEELLGLRFKDGLNILQAAVLSDALKVVKYLAEAFATDNSARRQLVGYREPNNGMQALHIAVIKGIRKIIVALLDDLKCDLHAVTAGGLSVLHCAS